MIVLKITSKISNSIYGCFWFNAIIEFSNDTNYYTLFFYFKIDMIINNTIISFQDQKISSKGRSNSNLRYWWISRLDSTFSYRYMNHLLLYVGLRYFLFNSGWDLNFCKHFSRLYNEVLACHLQFEILLLATNTGKEYTLYMSYRFEKCTSFFL